jgi:hypothetical protein
VQGNIRNGAYTGVTAALDPPTDRHCRRAVAQDAPYPARNLGSFGAPHQHACAGEPPHVSNECNNHPGNDAVRYSHSSYHHTPDVAMRTARCR